MSKQTDLINVTDAMTVSGSNVGIGTSSPLAKLDVASSASVTQARVRNQSTGAAAILFQNSDTGTGNGDGLYIGRSAAVNYLWTYENEPLVLATDNLERMRIDASGRVTMPYQPSFQAWSNSGGNEHFAGGTNPSFLTISSNVGNHFNGTTFTAPVSGRYLFFYTILSGTSGNYGLIALNVNGGPAVGTQNWTQHYTTTTNDQQNSGQQILTLSANDQVNLYIHPSHNRFYWNNAYSKFGGHLIG